MRGRAWLVAATVLAGCVPGGEGGTSTGPPPADSTTTSAPASTTTTVAVPLPGGHLIRLDPETLRPVPGLEAIPIESESWNLLSVDGSLLVNMRWDGSGRRSTTRVIDVDSWEEADTMEIGAHSARVVDGRTFYGYDERHGHGLFAVDLDTGLESPLAEWRHSLYFWDGLRVLSGNRLAGLGAAPSDVVDHMYHYSVYLYDTDSEEATVIPVGPIERVEEHSGIFDGEYEIPVWDSPGVAWGDDRLFIVHAEEPEVMEVDLDTGEITARLLDVSSWWDRLWAYWMPAASAKGPALGTYSSAALSPDGRYLFVSGNRSNISNDDGNLVETSDPLGLTVVDTETWRVVPSPELEIQFVRASNGGIIGVETVSNVPWVDEYHLLSVDDSGEMAHLGPFQVEGGGCEVDPSASHLFCTTHRGVSSHLDSIAIDTMTSLAGLVVGPEDVFHGIGVLEDWLPPQGS